MINFKKTLLNLHKAFPNLELEDLLKIMDCIEVESLLKLPEGTRDITTRPFIQDPNSPLVAPLVAPFRTDIVYCSTSEKIK